MVQGSHPIIVTGATGFIGQHMVPALLDKGYAPIVLTRHLQNAQRFAWHSKVQLVQVDLDEPLLDFHPPENATLIHLAWQNLNHNYQSLHHLEENLPRNYHFIKTLVERGLKNVIVTGTCLEYGLKNGPLASNTLTEPTTTYGLAKDSLHKFLLHLKKEKNFSLKWARLFYMHGPGQNPKSILAQLETAIQNNETVFNMSGGEQLRDYLPVETVAQKLIQLLKQETEGAFNICSGKPISVRSLVEQKMQEKGISIQMNLGHFPYSPNEAMAFWGVE